MSIEYDFYRNTFTGFVFQEYNLLTEFSVKKNINIANELQGKKPDANQVENLLNTVEIGGYENRKPAQLSGGQKQRVAIARALIKNPKIVLADEPTGALDSATGIQVMDILKELSKDKLIIIVSHEMEFAEKYADRIIKIVDGQVEEDITLSDVEVKDSVYDLGQELVVKTGVKLNKEEGEKVLTAIENNKKISVTDKISVRERKKTVEVESKQPENTSSFIKSKMKFKSIFALGIKSLFSKPVRLVFTILLSVIAFSVFGIFDAVASYNSQRAIAKLLEGNEYNAVSISATLDDSKYKQASIKLSKSYINSLNSQTGYAFRGVYDLKDKEEFGADRTNFNRTFSIEGISSGSGDFYYKRALNGIIEFKASEITNGVILKNSFNYKILPFEDSHYPTLQTEFGKQEVAISSYMADSIMFWLKTTNQKVFGGKIVDTNEISTLIGADLSFDYIYDTDFIISAIIDCGNLPAKYDLLKTEQAKKLLNLQYDFDTYLNSSCNLMLFMPDGYVQSVRESKGRVVSYVADYKNSRYTVETVGSINSSKDKAIKTKNSIFFNVNEFTAENTIMFDDVDNLSNKNPVLKNDEVLINVYNLERFFYPEEEDVNSADDIALIGQVKQKRNILSSYESTLQDKKQAVKDLIELFYQRYSILSEQQVFQKVFNKDIKISRYVGQSQWASLTKTYTVKGIYFDVDTDIYTASAKDEYFPLVMNEAGLKNMGINTNQGIYSRAISSLNGVNGNTTILGKMLTQKSGFMLSWYQNGIIDILEENSVFISQFVDLFLYASLIIMLFSVFMLMNYITASISSKRQTIGILRALGTNGASVFIMFLIESVIITLINGILACVVGYVASIFVNSYIIQVMSLTVNFAMFGIRQMVLIMLASMLTGLVASILPIIKIVKENSTIKILLN